MELVSGVGWRFWSGCNKPYRAQSSGYIQSMHGICSSASMNYWTQCYPYRLMVHGSTSGQNHGPYQSSDVVQTSIDLLTCVVAIVTTAWLMTRAIFVWLDPVNFGDMTANRLKWHAHANSWAKASSELTRISWSDESNSSQLDNDPTMASDQSMIWKI